MIMKTVTVILMCLSAALGLAGATVWAALGPIVQSVQPPPGTVSALTQITVTFSEPVTNVVATDLVINDGAAGEVAGAGAVYTFTLGFQPDYGVVQITWDPAHGIRDQDTPPNRFDETAPGSTWEYTFIDATPPVIASLTPAESVSVRSLTQIEVLFSEAVAGVDASDLLINSVPASGLAVLGVGKYRFTFPQPVIGAVQVEWASNHGIHDLAQTPNDFAGGSWGYTLDPTMGLPSIRLNEFLAGNVSGLADENGEAQDWIEIWNYGATPVNLAGYSLSDDAEDPGRWTFPATNLAPGQFFVVFASEKDRKTVTSATNRLHTNFKLNPNGEYLGLFNAESPRVAITEFAPEFPVQRNNHSYGYDSSDGLRYFAVPTPGGPNGASAISGVLSPPHFNVSRGYFDAPFTLILSTPVHGARILYTTDGSEPTLGATNVSSYSGLLTVSNTTVFRAAAFKDNVLPSLTVTHTYLFLEQIVNQPTNPPGFPSNWGPNSSFPGGVVPADYEMDKDPLRVDPNNPASAIDPAKMQRLKDGLRELPVLSIVMKRDDIFGTQGLYQRSAVETGSPGNKPENKKPCSVEMILPDGTTAFATTCGIDLHGNASRNPVKNPKHGFKLNFRSDFGPPTLQYRLFEDSLIEEYDDVLLRADFNSSWRHWSDTASQGLGAFQRTRATRTRDAWMKQSMRDMGGLASHSRFCHLYLNGLYWGTFDFSEDPTEVFARTALGGSEADFDVIDQGVLKNGTLNAYNAMVALPAATSLTNYERYHQYLNLPEFIDYMLLHFLMGHQDWSTSVTKNWSAIRKRVAGPEGTFRYQAWDGECILLNEDVNRVTVATPPSGLHTKLDDSPEYRLAFADHVHRHMIAPGGALTPPANIARWQKWQAIMDKPIVAESVRWGDYRRDVHRYSEGTYQLYTRENYWVPENSRMVNSYFANRNAIVLGQLRAANLYPAVSAPSFNQQGGPVAHGFSLTMTATNTIYYTLDGSDPRVYGTSAVSPSAAAYAGPVTLNSSMIVKARSRFGTNWSALNEATFTVDALASPLRLTEIMYNPMGGDAYEFLELQNVSGIALNVGVWSIDGAGYVFPPNTVLNPGQVIVLGSDASPGNWSNRYPGVTAFGRFSGKLDNGGEKLTIRNAAGQPLWSVDYDDGNGWPTAADGGGYSLEIIDVFGNPDDPANWRASGAANGTPGTISAPPATGAVVLNEVMADNVSAVNNGGFYPDWIELRNSGGQVVNLAGWSLTDDSNPQKFVFPANTMIPAGGYLVVWCDTNSLVPGLRAPFGLGRNGDSVFLYDANTNRVDAIGFGVQLPDYTVGRVGTGWTLTVPTAGAANTAATLGTSADLAINEWLADTPPGGDDWVEIYNPASHPVSLRGIYLGTGNATHQLTALSFIAAGGFLQLLADENPGANHLDFKLPAEGGAIVLYDETGMELDRVTYGPQVQGVTQGRLPDGAATTVSFPATPSPAASNYLLDYTGPLLNEVLAINRAAVTNAAGRTSDFVELRNTNAVPFDLSGMRLSTDPNEPSQWVFPSGVSIPANGYLVVWFDDDLPASTLAGPLLSTGHPLDGESGEVWLFNNGGQPVDSVVFGFQVADLPIGREAGGQWGLMSTATPGAANSAPAALGSPAGLRLNEWLAGSPDGDDWFEIYNPGSQPVDLGGLFLADSPAETALTQFAIPTLSFIGAKGFVRYVADGHPSNGRNHVNFSLDGEGEALRLYSSTLGVLDTVYFGRQEAGASQGRLTDGSAEIVSFPDSPTPAESNYLPLPGAIVNEVLTHPALPQEDALEIHNPTAAPVDIGGWYLSDSQSDFKKYRIADGTMLPAQGFIVFNQSQLDGGAGSLVPFTFDGARGGEVWLSAADGAGSLTGDRAGAKFGASASGVSIGRYLTSQQKAHFVAQDALTLDGANMLPKVGPVVLNELMYHPPDLDGTNDNVADEFVELYNLTTGAVPLFDPAAATNTWRLRGGVSFNFPMGVTLGPRAFLLVVSFDPVASPATLAAFRSKYGLATSVPIYGPYSGKLDNGGESVELRRPDSPLGPGPGQGFVPYLLVDRLEYDDAFPWSIEADGSGPTLQRRRPYRYGDDPVNWKADAPTPGRPNVLGSTFADADGDGISDPWEASNGLSSGNPADAGADADSDGRSNYEEFLDGTNPQSAASRLDAPVITAQPQSRTVLPGSNAVFSVTAAGTGPLSYQWYFNGEALGGQNAALFTLSSIEPPDAGSYSVVVWNGAGFAVSQPASLIVNMPPEIQAHPQTQVVNPGATATFTVAATGTGTLHYQWQRNGANIPNATNATLTITGAQLADEAEFRALVTDDITTVPSAAARLIVRVPPTILERPVGQTNVVGSDMTFSVTCSGSVPMGFQWRRGNTVLTNIVLLTTNSLFMLRNAQTNDSGSYRVVITNSGAVTPTTNATFTVLVVAPPVITRQPASLTVNAGTNVSFTVGVGGSAPFSYQWYLQNSPIAGATSATLSLSDVQGEDEGVYHVVVTNLAGSVTSQPAVLTVLVRPALRNPAVLPSGALQFHLEGNANRNYAIEISTNLTQWSTLTTLLSTNRLMPFTDLSAPASHRFYRARLLP
jgi:hypothetical protein